MTGKIAFRSDEVAAPINIGPDTAPETFRLERNAWFCLDRPERSRPDLPVPEADGIHGRDPKFLDPERGDLRKGPGHATANAGARDGSTRTDPGQR